MHENIANLFRNKMQKDGLTKKQVSKMSGLSQNTIISILKACKRNYRAITLIKMADFLQVRIYDMVGH